MHKILIVDDEPLARSNIVYYIMRSGFQFEWVQEARSAEEALTILGEANPPDILITDVVMGELSGLDLIKKAKEIAPSTLSIIVSGHDKFQYAQEALRHGAHQYLLKPLSQAQINDVLAGATAEVLKQKKFRRLLTENEMLEQRIQQRDLNIEIESLLHGVGNVDTARISDLFPASTCHFQVFIALLGEPDDSFHNSSHNLNKSYELLRYGLNNIISELAEDSMVPFKSYSNYRQVVILAASPEEDSAKAQKQLKETMEQIHLAVTDSLPLPLFIGGSAIARSFQGTQVIQAHQALDQRLCLPKGPLGGIHMYDELASHDLQYGQNQLDNDMKVLENYINDGMLSETLDIIKKIINSQQGRPFLLLRTAYIEILCMLSRSCYQKGANIFSFLGTEAISGSVIDTFDSLEELSNQLCHVVTTALVHWTNQNQDTSTILQQIKLYIQQNFVNSELGTSLLSERFCISSGYLSTLFRKTFAITISKYIIELRTKYANELLLTTDLTLQEISENCGFNNLSYFMRVFKKKYKQTPSEYRKSKLASP